ncbi:MAG TPA: ABC transporter substrate-binding protein, partial [Reyranella sp.]
MLTRHRLLAGVSALAAASFALPAAAEDTIKIGELNSYKIFAAFLDPYKKGWEMAVDEVNAAGGVLGKKIEIVSRDDNGNPADAVRVAEELLSREKVAFLIGTFPSNVG